MEPASGLGIPLERRAIPAGEMRSAEEAPVTGMMPLAMLMKRVDGEAVCGGEPGPVTARRTGTPATPSTRSA